MQNMHFTPPQLAPLFGINVSTIKRWINRGYLEAVVTAGGHRRITKEQLEKFIKKHPQYAKSSYILRRLIQKDSCPPKNCWKKYYRHLLNNNNKKAEQLVDKLFLSGTPVLEILIKVIMPTMQHIANKLTHKHISIYEERRMCFNIRRHLLHLDRFIPDRTKNNPPSAILTCAPGEFNEIPLQVISIVLKIRGWKTNVLGININIKELIKATKKIKPQLIAISKTYSKKDPTAYFETLTKYANRYKICLAFGGEAWQNIFKKKKRWTTRKCVHFFPTLSTFSEHLKDYERKKINKF